MKVIKPIITKDYKIEARNGNFLVFSPNGAIIHVAPSMELAKVKLEVLKLKFLKVPVTNSK